MAEAVEFFRSKVLDDPRFQALLAKAETHQRKFRPKETEALERTGQLIAVLQERTLTCWDSLTAARRRGMTMLEAQEEAFPMILWPDEEEEILREDKMPLISVPSNEPSSREKWVLAFEEAEASLRLEGMTPSLIFYELKERILAGEISPDEAVEILMANYPSNRPVDDDWHDLRQYDPPGYYSFMESLDPKLKELLMTDTDGYYKRVGELETPENFVALSRLYQQRQAARKLARLGGTLPDLKKIARRRTSKP